MLFDSAYLRISCKKGAVLVSDGQMKPHEPFVMSVETSRWSSLFNKGLKVVMGR